MATGADTKADQALTAVNAVVPFTIVADVAAIPALPDDGDRVQVTDATGIESFTPLTGLPAGFVGDSGINVSISFAANGLTWVYNSYAANDPDDRYGGAVTVNSVNSQIGDVVLDADDISDAATTNKYTTAADISKLAGIEAGAQANVVDSVNGQTGAVSLTFADLPDLSTLPTLP